MSTTASVGSTPVAGVNSRSRGVTVHRMNALDLIGRNVVDEHGMDYLVTGLHLDATSGSLLLDLIEFDETGNPLPGTESRTITLDGWQVY